jgi:hypothetical protein
LKSVSAGSPVPVEAGLLISVIAALFQLNWTPVVELVGVYENGVLLQIAGGVRVLVSMGCGFTTTVTV